MGREAASSPPRASANCLASSMFFCSLIPRPTATMISAWVRSTACLASLKTSCGLLRTTPSAMSTLHGLDRRGARAGFGLVAAESSVLESHKPGGIAGETDVGGELALEHLPGEEQLVAFFLIANAVADDGATHGGRELGNEIAHLIGVRHEHEPRLLVGDELFERSRRRRRGCRGRASAIRARRPCESFLPAISWASGRTLAPSTAASSVQPVSAARAWPAARISQVTRLSFPSRCSAMTRMVSGINSRGLGIRESDYSTRTSLRSFSTSFLATSAGGPSRNSVFLVFWGT